MYEGRITLKETNAERDLGVWMDNKLTFKDQILVTAKRANMTHIQKSQYKNPPAAIQNTGQIHSRVWKYSMVSAVVERSMGTGEGAEKGKC